MPDACGHIAYKVSLCENIELCSHRSNHAQMVAERCSLQRKILLRSSPLCTVSALADLLVNNININDDDCG